MTDPIMELAERLEALWQEMDEIEKTDGSCAVEDVAVAHEIFAIEDRCAAIQATSAILADAVCGPGFDLSSPAEAIVAYVPPARIIPNKIPHAVSVEELHFTMIDLLNRSRIIP